MHFQTTTLMLRLNKSLERTQKTSMALACAIAVAAFHAAQLSC
jgi:hypothetical protein